MRKITSSLFAKISKLPPFLFLVWATVSILATGAFLSDINTYFPLNSSSSFSSESVVVSEEVPAHFIENKMENSQEDETTASSPDNESVSEKKVLGNTFPDLDFVASYGQSVNDGVVVLSSEIDPLVKLRSSNFDGEVNFELYKLKKEDLNYYLTYYLVGKNDSSYFDVLKKYQVDKTKLEKVSNFSQSIVQSSKLNDDNRIDLSLEREGIWYLEAIQGNNVIKTVIIRSSIAGIANRTDGTTTYWIQDEQKQSVSDAEISLINLNENASEIEKLNTDSQGLATGSNNQAIDLALISKGNSFTIIPVNLTEYSYRYSDSYSFVDSFGPRRIDKKSFLFTDRILYKPSDTLYLKAIIRNDDDADYSVPTGQVSLRISGGENFLYEKLLTIDSLGTIDDQVLLPEDISVGYYSITIYQGDSYLAGSSFQVAEFRKPDSQVSINVETQTYYPGDSFKAKISGTYFLGQPLRDQEVRYKIYQNDAYTKGDYKEVQFSTSVPYYDQIGDPFYEGTVTLDSNGEANLELDVTNDTGQRKIWVVIIEYLDASGVATNDGVQVLVNPGDFVIESNSPISGSYVKNQTASVPFKLVKTKEGAKISGFKIKAKHHYLHEALETNKDLKEVTLTSDSEGKFNYDFTPDRANSYYFKLETNDEHGNYILGKDGIYVQEKEPTSDPVSVGRLSLTLDKESYSPGDTATITIDSENVDLQDMFMFVGRKYSREYRVLQDGAKQFQIQIPEDYQPNVNVIVGSFDRGRWISGSQNIEVKTDDKKINVSFSFDQETYGPAQTAQLSIQAKDDLGNPVETDMAVWVFDKALLELAKSRYSSIFSTFWSQRYASPYITNSFLGLTTSGAEGGGGCFAGETTVLMADNSQKRIDQVKQGDYIKTFKDPKNSELVSAKVLNVHKVSVDGYLIINQDFKVTPEHRLFVNGEWKMAADIKMGDKLLSFDGQNKTVQSIEWVRGSFDVYNLYIEKYHTFIAGGVYVHNDKGDDRSVFKDTAYWNPHVSTDVNGQTSIAIQLPDNLTTWVVASVAANDATQVGGGDAEFIVTKEMVVRPILPAFLRQGDLIKLSAFVHNFTQKDLNVEVVANLSIVDFQEPQKSLTVKAKDQEILGWQAKIEDKDVEAIFNVKAESKDENKYVDSVTQSLKVYEYGFWQDSYQSAVNDASYSLTPSVGSDSNRSSFKIQLRANKYPEFKKDFERILLSQTYDYYNLSSSLAVAGVAKKYGNSLGLGSNSSQIDDLVASAMKTFGDSAERALSYWSTEDKDRIQRDSIKLLEALVYAKESGLKVDDDNINIIINKFSSWLPVSWQQKVLKQYALSLVNTDSNQAEELPLNSQLDGQLISYAVLANYRNGFIGKQTAIDQILSIKNENDFQISWRSSIDDNYQGVYESTLTSVLALLELDADKNVIEKGLDYLYRNRNYTSSSLLIRAIADYLNEYADLNARADYKLSLNGEIITSGSLKATEYGVIDVDLSNIKPAPDSQLAVVNTGSSPLYSKLIQTEFITDKATDAQSHHLGIKRTYLSGEKQAGPTKVGDLVVVEFEISNLGLGERNLTITDYLPSGLVAIDQSLDNGVFDKIELDRVGSQKISGQGVILNIRELTDDVSIVRYKARVVSEGEFDAPPAIIRHDLDPSLWARSESSKLIIDGKSKLASYHTDNKLLQTKQNNLTLFWVLLIVVLLVVVVVAAFFIRKKLILSRSGADSEPLEQSEIPEIPQPPQTIETSNTDETSEIRQ